MHEFIVIAAARVLRAEGALGFTTNKVADEAGISVGSLYQYYPNKAALLFHLHEREARATWQAIESILDERHLSPRERLGKAVTYFFQSEAEEAELRTALKQAEVFFHETPEFRALQAQIFHKVRQFLQQVLSKKSKQVDFCTELVLTTVSSVAEEVSSRTQDSAQVQRWAQAISTMLCAHLDIE
jgi:AcrR family transcriptional regulator